MHLEKFASRGLRPRLARHIALAAFCAAAASTVSAQPQPQPQSEPKPPEQPSSALWGPAYEAAPVVVADQAQVVLFRGPVSGTNVSAANVYIDGGFHTALLPQGYSRFCMAKGIHSLEAYVGDAPRYAGKFASKTQVKLEGGKTYFVGVSENGSGEPVPFTRAAAEPLLASTRLQRHVISRANAVVPCKEAPASAQSDANASKQARYTLSADLLFAAGKGDFESLTVKGREQLGRLARQLQSRPIDKLQVRGHADSVGSTAANLKLSEARARAVSRALTEAGVVSERGSTVGVGSAEPVVSCPASGPRAARVTCNAPNRRIEVLVEAAAAAAPSP